MEQMITTDEPMPYKGMRYWYIRSSMCRHGFHVHEAEWEGGVSDMLRLAKRNVFFNKKDAYAECTRLDMRFYNIREYYCKEKKSSGYTEHETEEEKKMNRRSTQIKYAISYEKKKRKREQSQHGFQ